MTNPTDPARMAAIKAQLAALSAELDDLTATPETPDIGAVTHNEPTPVTKWTPTPPQTVEDALAAVRKRHGKTRSEAEAEKRTGSGSGDAPGDAPLTGAAAGVAAARKRYPR